MARDRRFHDHTHNDEKKLKDFTQNALSIFLETPEDELDELREFITRLEMHTGTGNVPRYELRMREGGHLLPFPLPQDDSLKEFRERIKKLQIHGNGLPEENLFYPPETLRNDSPQWDLATMFLWNGVQDWRDLNRLKIWKSADISKFIPWLFSRDWWMYQHDTRHSGAASGYSNITSTSAGWMNQRHVVPVDGPVITKPSIVDGKIYVGSGKQGGIGGTLYKIDLATGIVEHTFPTTGTAFYSWVSGIGGSPAVVSDRVYFTGVHGRIYCIDANTFAPIWSTDLKNPDPAHNQPINNINSDSWSGPLVVNGKVYVGSGEGESAPTYGIVFCLDALTGNVIWCFCTCKFAAGADNQPNHIPAAAAISNPLPVWATAAGFVIQSNPPETGCAVWSSCGYDIFSNRIYVGTGNSQYPHTAQPDEKYGSGLISLDANTGQFRGFFQPTQDDSYWPGDSDIDVPGSPTLFTLGRGQRAVAFGSKNGSFFVLNANTLVPIARRQMLPRMGGSGVPGDRGTAIDSVVPTGGTGENMYGIMGTPAIHSGLRRIFVGIGGYNGMATDPGPGIDQTRTPFLRAVNWNDLLDAWPTALGADGVTRYTLTRPPMYLTTEVGLSSPAVVNDVVFISTDKVGLYALDAFTGLCLWSASGLPSGSFALGPAIYGDYVVMGAGNAVYIYKLGPIWWLKPEPLPYPVKMLGEIEPVHVTNPPGPWPGPPVHPQIQETQKREPDKRNRRKNRKRSKHRRSM
jgi:outer membrane protein assembly factor BamB